MIRGWAVNKGVTDNKWRFRNLGNVTREKLAAKWKFKLPESFGYSYCLISAFTKTIYCIYWGDNFLGWKQSPKEELFKKKYASEITLWSHSVYFEAGICVVVFILFIYFSLVKFWRPTDQGLGKRFYSGTFRVRKQLY